MVRHSLVSKTPNRSPLYFSPLHRLNFFAFCRALLPGHRATAAIDAIYGHPFAPFYRKLSISGYGHEHLVLLGALLRGQSICRAFFLFKLKYNASIFIIYFIFSFIFAASIHFSTFYPSTSLPRVSSFIFSRIPLASPM